MVCDDHQRAGCRNLGQAAGRHLNIKLEQAHRRLEERHVFGQMRAVMIVKPFDLWLARDALDRADKPPLYGVCEIGRVRQVRLNGLSSLAHSFKRLAKLFFCMSDDPPTIGIPSKSLTFLSMSYASERA